ncbi:galactose-1-phosphate uridylyltransferase [Clostridia bacterium]|nr:galactose-1-phosphate uridylyltransferase [Clostridia bacterium]
MADVPELRKDFLTGLYVTISEARGNRPYMFNNIAEFAEESGASSKCPFCPENSELMPETVYTTPNGLVRVIPNKYMAFSSESPTAYGFHEVVIDTLEHKKRVTEMKIAELFEVFFAIQQRLRHYAGDERIKYVQVIKNDGKSAGASLRHLHWQIFAMSFLPERPQKIQNNFLKYHRQTKSCFFCDRGKMEILKVAENNAFIAYCPFASTYTNMVNIAPKRHVSDFGSFTKDELKYLSQIFKVCVSALRALVPNIAYNVCFQNALYNTESPEKEDEENEFSGGHFFLQIIPRISNMAGFEFATDCYINSVRPEKTCELLKNIIKNGKT